MIKLKNNETIKLVNVTLGSSNDARVYTLDLTYIVESEDKNEEVTFNNVPLNIVTDRLPIFTDRSYIVGDFNMPFGATLDYGMGDVSASTIIYQVKTKHEIKKMTLDEIEKKLGHKVKIVCQDQI